MEIEKKSRGMLERYRSLMIVPNLVFAIERTVVHMEFAQVRVCIHREP
jgi:hypothetical protein